MGTTNCHDCGCGPSIPEPCITPPPVCPDPQPCTEVIDAQCVVYTTPPTVGAAALRAVSTYAAPETKSVAQAITELENRPVTIEIPKLKVGAMNGDVFAALDFYQTADWQNLNPRIFLFRTKKAKKPRSSARNSTTGRPSQFVHPVHLVPTDKTNSRWWKGSAKYSDEAANPIIRNTEFAIPNFNPYNKFNLKDVGLDKYQWVTKVVQGDGCEGGIRIVVNTESSGNVGFTLKAAGVINDYPYYTFTLNGTVYNYAFENQKYNNYVLYCPQIYNVNQPCVIGTGYTSTCPVGGTSDKLNVGGDGAFSNGEIFYYFYLEILEYKRQSVNKDFNNRVSTDDIGRTFRINGSQQGFSVDNYLFNQKIHFKLAVVIDNPNPTPEIPYLIGPMSDSFVLKFSRYKDRSEGLGLKFTNDYTNSKLA